MSYWSTVVACPLKGCGYATNRSNMYTHLVKLDHREAFALDPTDKVKRREILDSARVVKVVADPRTGTHGAGTRSLQRVACPANGCEAKPMQRGNMCRHLMVVHKWDRSKANHAGRVARVIEGDPVDTVPSMLPAVREHVPVEAPADWTGIDPADIAMSVIESQAGATIPVELLAECVAYVDITRSLVARLRASR